MNAIVCTKHNAGLIKEVWEPCSQTLSLCETDRPFRMVLGNQEKTFQKLEREICGNYYLPKGLRIISDEDYSYFHPSLTVYRYPIFIPSYDQPNTKVHKGLRELVKALCMKTNGPIILAQGNESLGYKVSSKRVSVDGDFVVTYQEKHVVIAYDPKKAKKIKRRPGMIEDYVHRNGHFRIGELTCFMSIFEHKIRTVPELNKVVHWIIFLNLRAPKEIDAAKKVLKLAKAVVHVCRSYAYRDDEEFYDFLEKARVVLKSIRRKKIQGQSYALRKFYAFLRHEIRIAIRRGKMV